MERNPQDLRRQADELARRIIEVIKSQCTQHDYPVVNLSMELVSFAEEIIRQSQPKTN